jgi:hypothetical protein
MKTSLSASFLAPLCILAAVSFALAPAAVEARGGGGGGGGARQSAQVGSRGDVRTNDVRSTSVNNVNVNVNVDQRGGGWDNDRHPVAAAIVIGAAAGAIGSTVYAVPSNCVPVSYAGMVYQQCGDVWYQPYESQWVVVSPPY